MLGLEFVDGRLVISEAKAKALTEQKATAAIGIVLTAAGYFAAEALSHYVLVRPGEVKTPYEPKNK